jgi:hypothetical protein
MHTSRRTAAVIRIAIIRELLVGRPSAIGIIERTTKLHHFNNRQFTAPSKTGSKCQFAQNRKMVYLSQVKMGSLAQ